MRSEFEKLLKQHRAALTDELVKLGKHRQAQLAEWDIEQNESDYEFYFNAAWNAQQSKVDALTLQVAEMKSRLTDAYTDGQSAMYAARQSKIDELQYKAKLRESDHQALLVKYQATKKCWEDMSKEKDELQKRVDAALKVLAQLNSLDDECWRRWKREACLFSQGESNAYEHAFRLLEQALKGCDMKISQELSLSELRGNSV